MKGISALCTYPEEALKENYRKMSFSLVLMTIAVVTILDPVLAYFIKGYDIDIYNIILMVILGIAAYLFDCSVFWLIGKGFGGKANLMVYINKWGITFLPTLFCAVFVVFTENYYELFVGNELLIILFNFLFIGVLFWKTIIFVVFLKTVPELKGARLVAAFLILCIIIVFLALLYGRLGLRTPII